MNQIGMEHIQKSFGEKEVLRDVTLYANYGERIGIVGENGSGKSTLLHILAGLEQADGGTIRLSKGTSFALLRQDGRVEGDDGIGGEVRRFLKLMQSERTDGKLSGGERTKLALSKLFAREVNVLLLDEPTNNLDYEGIQVLLSLLHGFEGTVIAVSHDRYFLDQLVERVVEIDGGAGVEYFGNYSDYREQKQRRYRERLHRFEDQQKEQKRIDRAIGELKEWSAKGHRESTQKSKNKSGVTKGFKEFQRKKVKKMDRQVKSQVKRLEALKSQGEKRPEEEAGVYFQIKSQGKQGKRVLQAEGLTKSFGERTLFADSDFSVNFGERVAIFGPNGAGKTTLVNLILGDEQADRGSLWVSPSSAPFVLHQTFLELPKEKTVLKFFLEKFGRLDGNDRKMLHNMGLSAVHINQRIGTLSFGEQMKVKMAESILNNQDFLILDEPTNHLDLHAREMLEQTLREYGGTLLLVSHDIYFLRRVCNKVLAFEDGKIRRYEYDFAAFLERREED